MTDRRRITRKAVPVAIGFGLIWSIVVSYFSYGLALSYIAQIRASRAFQPVDATVLSSRVHTGRAGPRGLAVYSPIISYRYVVQGTTYESTNYAFMGKSPSLDEALSIVDQYPPGVRVVAYYDPKHPSQAVLDRTEPPLGLPALVIVLLWGFGVAVLVIGFRGRKRREPLRSFP